MKNGIAFGPSGWRGMLGDDCTEENVARIAHAFVRYLFQQHLSAEIFKVAIGFDGRTSSREFAYLIAKVLAENGVDVLLSSRVVPTPALSFATLHNGCTSGIMVTGGNLPSEYNGIEFKGTYGGPFTSEATTKVEAFLSNIIQEPTGLSKPSKKEIIPKDFLPDYLSHLETIIDLSALRSFAENPRNNANVLIDSMGGAGQTIIEDILVGCGWRAQTLFGTPENRFFDRRPESVPMNLGALKYNVAVVDAQFGIATDGDGSRCSVVYNDGEWMNTQDTMLALLWHLHDQKGWRGNILKSAAMTDKVKRLCNSWKIPLVDLGFGRGVEEMLKVEWMLGIMGRGGFCYGRHIPECDGILSGLFVAEMIAKSVKPLHEIIQEIWNTVGRVYCDSVDMKYDAFSANQAIKGILNSPPKDLTSIGKYHLEKYESKGRIFGLKFRWGDCRWLFIELLPIEPVARLHCEGGSKEDVSTILEAGIKCLKN